MDSLNDLLDIVEDGFSATTSKNKLSKFMLTSLPLSGTARDTTTLGRSAVLDDADVLEVQGLWSNIRMRYLGEGDGARRDLLGVKRTMGRDHMANYAMKLRSGPVSDKVIAGEMSSLPAQFSRMGDTYRGTVKLTDSRYNRNGQNAWDRAQELSSTVKIGGKDMRQALRAEIASERYQALPFAVSTGNSPRADRLKRVLDRYRSKGMRELLREIPEIRQDDRETRRAIREASRPRRGGLTLL